MDYFTLDGQNRDKTGSTGLTIFDILLGPRFVYDPTETGVDDWMLYIPKGYIIKNGAADNVQRDPGQRYSILP